MSGHTHEDGRCRRLLGALSEYIDGDLEAELCQQIDAHLAGCENCRIVVDTLRKTVLLYRSDQSPSLPSDVEERLLKALDLEEFMQRPEADA